MNYFPKNLKYMREKHGLNQANMLEHVSIRRTAWSNYEVGFTNPTINEIIIISRFFGISLDDLILVDLEAEDPHPQKKKKKPKPYPIGEKITFVAEPAVSYVLQRLQGLEKVVDNIKKKAGGPI